ncbi:MULTISPECIES: peptidylprolyl isomerase [Streptomyces]|uniref:Peptidylprolyl isomerase n=2 Tax=Streptomyces TaxID=1883 RepID=A0A5P2B683_STRVZ|nr:peptidylprolyl isomerase [Streptomyces venezuelae]MYY83575.1 peptidylprolyl isomerase [Streptomyces sp. SID335]MYZ13483.1 peptidylprolyl isomerase [Streptomyces sp. SID337]NDZ97813.1 peptidylprolyl isomerase [Streptomyces sp. SID10116]NEB43965.1 peptidylprolyl isomerase [Streptomyces sp. SID339]QES26072.1 peptidylprolyl isomerase [Streptomyces venezuelae]
MVSQEQRRKQLAREKLVRQQQRREAARRRARARNAVIAGALAVVVAGGAVSYAAGAFDGDDTKDDASASPSSTPKDPCAKAAPGKVKPLSFDKEPKLAIDKSADYTMDLQTTCGDIALDLDAAKAPRTVNSFDFLVKKGYLDHTRCHRLTTGGIYVLQCGDPKGDGTGTPGYKIPDENLKDERLKGKVYPAGTVAMANQYNARTKKGRNSGGSQFFLVYQDSQLPPDYTPFGTISDSGMKVLKKIAAAGESSGQGDGAPNATVVIDKATVTKS